MNFRFITAVWGPEYTDLLLRIAIPTQLSPGNFPSFPDKETSKYLLYTTSKDAATIRNAPSYRELSRLIATELVSIDDIDLSRNRYWILSECHRRAIVSADGEDCAFVFLLPDDIMSDGVLANMAKIAATGTRAVMCAGLSSVKNTCVPALLDKFSAETGAVITISPRQLVALSLEHLDPAFSALFWDSPTFHKSPSLLYWNVPGEGVLTRWFTPHPLMLRPRKLVKSFDGSVTGADFIIRACPDPDDLYVVEDSDEVFLTSVRTPTETFAPNKPSAVKVARWAAGATNRHNRRFLSHKLRFHYADVSERWEHVERESDAVVDTILSLLRFRLILMLIDWKKSLGRLRWDLTHTRLGRAAVNALKRKRAAW